MKKRWIVLAVILITIINISALGTLIYNRWTEKITDRAIADTVSHGCYMKNHLGITDEQACNLDTIDNIYRHKIDPVSRQIIEIRRELVSELLKEKSDSLRIEQLLRSIDSLQNMIQKDAVHRLIAEKNMLTEDQRSKYFSLVLGKLCYKLDSLNNINCQKHIKERK
jgi:hypothetical protein